MRVKTLAAYLVGDRDAILRVAEDRSAIAIGALFVLSAAFAREYDGVDLRREPWRLASPFVASLGMSAVLFLGVRFGLTPRSLRQSNYRHSFRAFLGCFWMTAPFAWLYAIPYERFLSESDAVFANVATFGFVALWRVLLITRVSAVLSSRRFIAAIFVVLLLADAAMLLAIRYSPAPPIDFMSGLRLTVRERFLEGVRIESAIACVFTLPVWLIGGAIVIFQSLRIRAQPAEAVDGGLAAGYGGWWLAIVSVAIWAFLLPGPQREQRLAGEVDRMLQNGEIPGALALMSSHSRSDFPPVWEPPPRISYYEQTPSLLDVIELIEKQRVAAWVRTMFIDKFERAELCDPPWAISFEQRKDDWDRVTAVLSRLPEGNALRERHFDEIQGIERQIAARHDRPPRREPGGVGRRLPRQWGDIATEDCIGRKRNAQSAANSSGVSPA